MKYRRFLAPLLALFLLTVSAAALEPVERPICNGGYTHYAIDGGGTLWAWGDSFHGGITAEEDPVLWENAVPEVENARNAYAGFVTGVAVDKDGVLWGFGSNHAGKLLGQDASQGAVRLMDHVVYAEVWDVNVCALRDDGTLWLWGGGVDVETMEPLEKPHQIMDHVQAFWENYIQMEDGTWVEWRRNGADGSPIVLPVAAHAAEVRDGAGALLMLGENGELYRAARNSEGWYDAPELLLEHVVSVSNFTAVTADGALWAWGSWRPAMLKDGAPDPEDPYDRDLPEEELAVPVRITEGVRYAEASSDCTLAVMEDGSLWELPSAYDVSIQEEYPPEEFPEVRTTCRKLLDQAWEVSWLEIDPDAPAPELLAAPAAEAPADSAGPAEEEAPEEAPAQAPLPRRELSGWAALAALLPLAAAVLYHVCKGRLIHRENG